MYRWSLLGIRRIDRIPNTRVRYLCGGKEGWMKVFYGGLAIERKKDAIIAKRGHKGVYKESLSGTSSKKLE